MSSAKIAISIDNHLLVKIDALVKEAFFKNRSQAIQAAVRQTVERLEHRRLATECAKLNPDFEKKMADEGLAMDAKEWPEY